MNIIIPLGGKGEQFIKSKYHCDLKDAICYVPYFTSIWFGSVKQDELIDKNFPYFFITKLGYLLEYLFHDII